MSFILFILYVLILEVCHNKNNVLIELYHGSMINEDNIDKNVWKHELQLKFEGWKDCTNLIRKIPNKNQIKSLKNMHFSDLGNLLSLTPERFKYLKKISLSIEDIGFDFDIVVNVILNFLIKFKLKSIEIRIGEKSFKKITK